MAIGYLAQAAKGPGSWGFEGRKAMKPGVRRGTPLEAIDAGTSSIGKAGTSSIGRASTFSIRGADTSSIGNGAGASSIICEAGGYSVDGESSEVILISAGLFSTLVF